MRLFLRGLIICLLGSCLLAVGGCAKGTVEAERATHTDKAVMPVRAESVPREQEQAATVKRVKFLFDDGEAVVELYDNPTSRDLQSLLPLTLRFKDYSGTEKIADPPRALSVKEAPPGFEPSFGDLTLFAPWGNLAVFYRDRDFDYANGLVSIGRITSGMDKFAEADGDFTVRLEAVLE